MSNKKTFDSALAELGLTKEQVAAAITLHKAEIDETVNAGIQAKETAIKEAVDSAIQAKEAEFQTLQTELSELKAKFMKVSRRVDGTFKAIDKKKYCFKPGILKFSAIHPLTGKMEEHDAAVAIEDKALMQSLVEMGAGIIEEVTQD